MASISMTIAYIWVKLNGLCVEYLYMDYFI